MSYWLRKEAHKASKVPKIEGPGLKGYWNCKFLGVALLGNHKETVGNPTGNCGASKLGCHPTNSGCGGGGGGGGGGGFGSGGGACCAAAQLPVLLPGQRPQLHWNWGGGGWGDLMQPGEGCCPFFVGEENSFALLLFFGGFAPVTLRGSAWLMWTSMEAPGGVVQNCLWLKKPVPK